jgi:peptide subunit release factor 1 (eRF1)
MISLIIPPKDQISRVSKMLADEFGTGEFEVIKTGFI